MTTGVKQPRVAVIGLGGQGLVTLKNLLEAGFDVTGFERNDYVGGIWHYSAEHRVSALPTTVVNVSRERACFTDFPFPDGISSYPSSAELDKYLNDYTDHFNLWPHLRLNTSVKAINHNDDDDTWSITVQSKQCSTETLCFDKVAMAVGPHSTPIIPDLPGKNLFAGEITHSITFKDPLLFAHKRVVVVGASNTAADTVTSLVGIASKVYLSHRHGTLVLPRFLKTGQSLDHALSYRQGAFKDLLDTNFPRASQKFMDNMTARISASEFGTLDPQWRLTPIPSIIHQVPTVTDTLIPHLRAGEIVSIHAPAQITGSTTIALQDGTTVDADAIIFATGYHLNLSILGRHDPTLKPDGTHDPVTPPLYQNIFSLEHPHSLAFIGIAIVLFPAFVQADLSTMALAQLWSNRPSSPSLPSQKDMEAWYAQHLRWVESVRSLSPHRKYVKFTVQNGPWLSWVQSVAGTNVEQHLSYLSIHAWRFWWSDRKFCSLLMDGVWSPHMYRVFDGDRRKKWDGARAAIVTVNEDIKARLERRKKGQEDVQVDTVK